MLVEIGLFLLGILLLVFGADRAVRAAGELALFYGVSPFFIGVSVVSIGTSIPEMTTSVYSAYYRAGDLVVGNIVGSETAQITLAIAVVALIAPITTNRRNILVYGSAMVLAMVIMILTLDDQVIGRAEGVLMMLAYVQFLYILYSSEGGEEITEEVIDEREPPQRAIPWIVLGLVFVIGGGHLLVTNGVAIARLLGVSEYLIGLLTGLGTTMPEVVVAGVAAKEGSDISVGSLLGSNITDPVFSLGIGALVADVTIQDPGSVGLSLTYMVVVSLIVLGLMYWRRGIDRRVAILCLGLYLPSFAFY